jgi:hypothetical protein
MNARTAQAPFIRGRGRRNHQTMGYARAVEHLRQVAGACEAHLGWHGDPIIVGAYVFGPLLDGPQELDHIDVAFAVALPPEQVPWGVTPPAVARFLHATRLDRLPLRCYCRPSAWPVANHHIRQPVRIWSTDGVCPAVINLMAQRRFADLRPEPAPSYQPA